MNDLSPLLALLACPACGGELAPREENSGAAAPEALACQGCGRLYAIAGGVPRLNEEVSAHQLESVARTFGFEWKAHHGGEFESETLFGRTREEDWAMVTEAMRISDADVRGARVLDAGSGSGRFCQLFAEHGAEIVVGVDINTAVDEAAQHCAGYDNIFIVQGNIFALPFKPGAFDLIWCNGVIHHTPDAAGAHRSLSRYVRPGGVLYVWVYAARFNPFRLIKSALRHAQLHRWPPRVVQGLATAMAYGSIPLLWCYQQLRKLPGLRARTTWSRRTIRPRTVEELKLTWFDTLSPEFDTRHSEREVIGWFEREGFAEIQALEEPKVGVRGVAANGRAEVPAQSPSP